VYFARPVAEDVAKFMVINFPDPGPPSKMAAPAQPVSGRKYQSDVRGSIHRPSPGSVSSQRTQTSSVHGGTSLNPRRRPRSNRTGVSPKGTSATFVRFCENGSKLLQYCRHRFECNKLPCVLPNRKPFRRIVCSTPEIDNMAVFLAALSKRVPPSQPLRTTDNRIGGKPVRHFFPQILIPFRHG